MVCLIHPGAGPPAPTKKINMKPEVKELLKKYKKFPYAVDACLYFFHGIGKDYDSIIYSALRGRYGKDSQVIDYSELSAFMMGWEDDYLNNLEEINEYVMNLETYGGVVSDFY